MGGGANEKLIKKYMDNFNIKSYGSQQLIAQLSGGNQQKVAVAKWLVRDADVFVFDEPTRGIDVGAKGEIEKLVASLREEGMAVIFISSELEEVVRTCGRVAVLRDREVIGELEGGAINEQAVMAMIAKGHEQAS